MNCALGSYLLYALLKSNKNHRKEELLLQRPMNIHSINNPNSYNYSNPKT